jgi:hypothetical protein
VPVKNNNRKEQQEGDSLQFQRPNLLSHRKLQLSLPEMLRTGSAAWGRLFHFSFFLAKPQLPLRLGRLKHEQRAFEAKFSVLR